jgi:hypothetical protein
MVTLMIHCSEGCDDPTMVYNLMNVVITDLKVRTKTTIDFIVTNTLCNLSEIVSYYCQQNYITYNIIDNKSDNSKEAVSEINLTDSIMLAIPATLTINDDVTMKSVTRFLTNHLRTIILYNYHTTTLENMKDNIMYYNF